ncbi:hypothetical protein HJFPF1_11201 [Paramyrothecium foliicola]|nr:hypothetical protein HJFPF1_11201 [Paramyrothecium foliicola]
MQNLSSHQHLLTSLVDTLESTSAVRPDESAAAGGGAGDRRRMLLTLHVLFPTLLLPALDLLDRRLVTRINRDVPRDGASNADALPEATSTAVAETAQDAAREGSPSSGLSGVYVVQSVASTLTRRTRDALSTTSGSSTRTYLVQLDVWHCSCPSFALEAFPARPVPTDTTAERDDSANRDWSFGGRQHGGLGGNAPCCKHLLACLLARKCSGVTGGHVASRSVSKEEFAGLITDM